jgi:hypothetical protein
MEYIGWVCHANQCIKFTQKNVSVHSVNTYISFCISCGSYRYFEISHQFTFVFISICTFFCSSVHPKYEKYLFCNRHPRFGWLCNKDIILSFLVFAVEIMFRSGASRSCTPSHFRQHFLLKKKERLILRLEESSSENQYC